MRLLLLLVLACGVPLRPPAARAVLEIQMRMPESRTGTTVSDEMSAEGSAEGSAEADDYVFGYDPGFDPGFNPGYSSGSSSGSSAASSADYDYDPGYDVDYMYDYISRVERDAGVAHAVPLTDDMRDKFQKKSAALLEQVRIISCQLSHLTEAQQAAAAAGELQGLDDTWAKWCAEHGPSAGGAS